MMMSVIAMPGMDASMAGAIVWWALSGNVNHEQLCEAWLAAGLPKEELPNKVAPGAARWRAAVEHTSTQPISLTAEDGKTVIGSVRKLARPLARREGCAVVREIASPDKTLTYETLARMTPGASGGIKVEALPGCPADLVPALEASYAKHLQNLSPDDVSSWLTSLARRLKAVALRPSGGTYFVPRQLLDGWRSRMDVISSLAKHKGYEIPALQTAEAVEAILDALTREAEAEASALENELIDAELSGRQLKTRRARCEKTADKLATYEELLGKALPGLEERLKRLQASISEAMLAADGD